MSAFKIKKSVILLSGLSLLAVNPVFADSDSASFQVKVNIVATCDIHSQQIPDVDFGTVSSTASNVVAQSQLAVNCTPGTSYQITLGDGTHVAAGQRYMANGDQTVPYNLYSDQAHSKIWNTTNPVAGKGSGSKQVLPIYAVLPAANVPAGSYSDTVSATVTY